MMFNSVGLNGLNNVDHSIYSSINDFNPFHFDPETITEHLYPPPTQDYPQSIFVQIPICHNTQHQINRQQRSEIKSELIKSEVENVNTSLPSTQSTICTASSTVTTSIPSANICSQQHTPTTLITARPKSSIKCFKCTQCPFISISESGLKNHNDKSHNGNETSVFKQLKCFGCPNVFYSQNSLQVHLVKDHQMNEDEIKYLVQNLVLDGESIDENLLATPIKQKIYLKNLSILKAPEFRTDDGDSSASELFNNFSEGNHYANECEQSPPVDLYDDVSDDFINLIDDELNGQSDALNESFTPNDFQSKIFVKDMNNLKKPNYTTGHQFLFDDNQDFCVDTPQINLIDTPPMINTPPINLTDTPPISLVDTPPINLVDTPPINLVDTPPINLIDTPPPMPSTTIQSNFQSQNFIPTFENVMHEVQPKQKPCTIFINNVDILDKPIVFQTSGNSFVSTSPQPQPLYSGKYIPFQNQTQSTSVRNASESAFLSSPNKLINENNLSAPNQQTKIFIKNFDIMKKHVTTAPVAKKNMLHLRTVDDINLMNVNEAQNLRENFQEEIPRTSAIDNCNENYNDIEDYNQLQLAFDDFVTYCQNETQFPFQDIHSANFQPNNGNDSDFNQDLISVDCPTNDIIDLENIIDSTTSSIDEKAINKTEQFNGNNETQMLYSNCEGSDSDEGMVYDYERAFNEEMLFVSTEEVMNACEEVHDNASTTSSTTNDERPTQAQSNVVVCTEITAEAKDTSKSEEPAKGRIYVVSNLMKTTDDSNESNKQISEVISETNNDSQMVEVIESNDEEDVECVNSDNTKVEEVFLVVNSKKVTKRKKGIGRPKGGRNNRYSLNSANSKDDSAIKYQCTQNCTMKFSSSTVLSFHEQCHDPSQKKRIICPKCEKNDFRSFQTLHTHLWREHSIDMELYSCESCDFKTPLLSRLINTHMRIHSDERNYKCEKCDKAFKNAKQMKNHRAVHTELRVIRKCGHCDKLFYNQKHLRNHVRSVHEKLNEFKCVVCDHIFSSVVACQTHMMNHTKLLKKFQCETCSYSTNDRSGFRRHVKIHKGIKKYECCYCPFRCIQSQQFKSHILKFHPDVANEVLFSCLKCPYVTVNRSNFDLHQVHHLFKESGNEVACEAELQELQESDEDEVLIKFNK